MTNLIDSIADFLEKEGLAFHRSEETGNIWLVIPAPHGRWEFSILPSATGELVFFYSICPLKAPDETRPRLAQFLMMVNRIAFVGSFLMDFDTGEIRYETYLPCRDAEIPADAIECAIRQNLYMMNRYLTGIARIISSEAPPAEVFTEVETGKKVEKKYLYN